MKDLTNDNLVEKHILTVSALNRSVKKLLESHFQILWIEGEVSNLSKPQSGHIYFTLKDEQAQVRCAMFRMRHFSLPFILENGMHILAAAKISLYEGRGDYQLIIEHIEERGEGLLRRRYEALKNQLHKEGLFDLIHKKQLPQFPKRIGVITSPSGAAIRDVLSVLKRRFASIPVIIYPTSVQGEQAAAQIASAISLANQRNECDVLIICRGGGSLEDLFAFNDENVARVIFNSKIPIVSGIGHEIDFTIADFVADQRAPTPSAAAELLSPDKEAYCQRITELTARIAHLTIVEIRHQQMLIYNYGSRLVHPAALLQKYMQTVDLLQHTLEKALFAHLDTQRRKLELIIIKLNHLNPLILIKEKRAVLAHKLQTLNHLINRKITDAKYNLSTAGRTLNTISPLNTLERGYSIVTKNHQIIDDIKKVKPGDCIQVQVKTGFMFCEVEICTEEKPE